MAGFASVRRSLLVGSLVHVCSERHNEIAIIFVQQIQPTGVLRFEHPTLSCIGKSAFATKLILVYFGMVIQKVICCSPGDPTNAFTIHNLMHSLCDFHSNPRASLLGQMLNSYEIRLLIQMGKLRRFEQIFSIPLRDCPVWDLFFCTQNVVSPRHDRLSVVFLLELHK